MSPAGTLGSVSYKLKRKAVSVRICSAGTRKLKRFSAQAFFVQGSIDNTTNVAVEEWMEVIGMMAPQKVYIYGLKRIPPISGLKAADEDTLYTIASKLKRRTSIEALVFP